MGGVGGNYFDPRSMECLACRSPYVVGELYYIYEAPRAERVKWCESLKCLKTNLESQGVFCYSYRLVVLFTVNCTEMAHQKGPTFLSIPKQGYRPNIHLSV